jgi:hypothetical protein
MSVPPPFSAASVAQQLLRLADSELIEREVELKGLVCWFNGLV